MSGTGGAREARALDHVGVVTDDLEAAVRLYVELLGAEVVYREELTDQGVRVAELRYGRGLLELLAPTRSDTGVARFLERRGPGMHHVAFRVQDVRSELERLRARGARLIDEVPRAGLRGRQVAFVHPESAGGVLVELVQAAEARDGG